MSETNPIPNEILHDLDMLTTLVPDISKRLDMHDTVIEELKKKKNIGGHTNPHGSNSKTEGKLVKLEMMLKNSSLLDTDEEPTSVRNSLRT